MVYYRSHARELTEKSITSVTLEQVMRDIDNSIEVAATNCRFEVTISITQAKYDLFIDRIMSTLDMRGFWVEKIGSLPGIRVSWK